ncbi:SDR family NAD(P)-dependent oxidoreductase [Aspergillus stella-maris]|uniref:SDR family NAD(P)-dependent oxidoreductase n=1 Tax=Aspergillus stella-maris TaxID=1810926 RepID=UPI003CCCE58B
MSRPLEGKFGIVTGGSRGIGEAIAKNLASKGCSLLLNFTSESSRPRTEELCQSLASTHSIRCVSVQADLSTPEQAVKDILVAVSTHFPSTTIDILINNAGVSADRTLNDKEKGPIEPEYFNWQYNINVLAPLLLTQGVAPYLPNDRSGRIVNISSVSSSLGFVGQSVYGGTKAALEAMTRTWARELADRATVNAVNPGPVTGDMYFKTGEGFWNAIQGFQDNTPLSKLVDGKDQSIRDPVFEELGLTEEQVRLVNEKMGGRRPAFTEEVAGVVGMLCTRDGGWCTGSVVCANGGMKFGV